MTRTPPRGPLAKVKSISSQCRGLLLRIRNGPTRSAPVTHPTFRSAPAAIIVFRPCCRDFRRGAASIRTSAESGSFLTTSRPLAKAADGPYRKFPYVSAPAAPAEPPVTAPSPGGRITRVGHRRRLPFRRVADAHTNASQATVRSRERREDPFARRLLLQSQDPCDICVDLGLEGAGFCQRRELIDDFIIAHRV
jgi:hypothetical protein